MKRIPATIYAIAAGLSLYLLFGRTGFAARKSLKAPQAQDLMREQIISKEREGIDALKTGNLSLFANLTADDAVFVDDHGIAGKAEVVQNTAQFKLTDYRMDNVKFVAISANSGLISYEMLEKGTSHGKDFSAHVFVSSVWIERADKWYCLFSQESLVR
jgi:ketosteroid isomerase-like protein